MVGIAYTCDSSSSTNKLALGAHVRNSSRIFSELAPLIWSIKWELIKIIRFIDWLKQCLCGYLTSSASLSSSADHGVTVYATEPSVNIRTSSVISNWQHCLLQNVSSVSSSNCTPPSLFCKRKIKESSFIQLIFQAGVAPMEAIQFTQRAS